MSGTERGATAGESYGRRILLLLSLGSASMMVGRMVISPLLPTIIADLSITPSLAGLAVTAMWGVGALAQYPGGRAADRLSHRTVLAAALATICAGAALLAGARTYALFVLGATVIGLGAGLYEPTVILQLSELFPRRRGAVIGINTAAVNAGGVLAAGLAVLVLAADWRLAFVPVAVAIAGVLLLLHRWHREPYTVERVPLNLRSVGGRLLAPGPLRRILLAYTLYEVAWLGVTSFLPTFLQAEKGFGPAPASNAFGALFVVGTLATPLAGRISDRYRHALVAAGAAACTAVGLAALVVAQTAPTVVAGVLLAAAGLAGFWPPMHAYTMTVLGEGGRGGAFGAIRTLFITTGGLGPTYVGLIAERADYELAFAALLPFVLASGGLVLLLARSGPRAGR